MAKLANVEKRRLRNKSVRSYVKTTSTRALDTIKKNELDQASEAVTLAASALDRAVKKGVIHPNKAARRKSRLMKKLNEAAKG